MVLPCQKDQSEGDGRAVKIQIHEFQLLSADFCFHPIVPCEKRLSSSKTCWNILPGAECLVLKIQSNKPQHVLVTALVWTKQHLAACSRAAMKYLFCSCRCAKWHAACVKSLGDKYVILAIAHYRMKELVCVLLFVSIWNGRKSRIKTVWWQELIAELRKHRETW